MYLWLSVLVRFPLLLLVFLLLLCCTLTLIMPISAIIAKQYHNLTSQASVSGSLSSLSASCHLSPPSCSQRHPWAHSVTPGSFQAHRRCPVPYTPLHFSQTATIQQLYLCVHLLAPGTTSTSAKGFCSSLSDTMWDSPSCHQTQHPTHKTHRGTMNRSPLACQHFPLTAEPC